METPRITAGLCSTAAIRNIAAESTEPYLLLDIDSRRDTDISPEAFARMAAVMEQTGASIVYADHLTDTPGGPIHTPYIDYRMGSVRDDFDFGPLVLVNGRMLRQAVTQIPESYLYAGWYDVRLRLSRMGSVVRIPETLYTTTLTDTRKSGERQFDYVSPSCADVQTEMEMACTDHLKAIGAYLEPYVYESPDYGDGFKVEASVIIPVRNRAHTIADAVNSALSQQCDLPFNVIVVDNHSTDGTSEILASLAAIHPALTIHTPVRTGLGIGGCWNEALNHPACGRFAVQLDSDDLYSSGHTLSAIISRFRQSPCAMVIGSYTLTDLSLNTLPPGVIRHSEWTDTNGRNNALRINGFGAPRAYATAIARRMPMPDVSYGEDYAMCLQMSRLYPVGRIFDSLYLCRRWDGNSDSDLSHSRINANNAYKDTLRTWEIKCRKQMLLNK